MNVKLATLCLWLWILGFFGMWTAKGLFDLGPGAVGFDLFAALWAIGGLTYALLGALCVLDGEHAQTGA